MKWYIPIDKGAIPYRFEMRLAETTYGFEIRYNSEHDFFTIDLYRGSELIVSGEKIIYDQPLFADEFENITIRPFDQSSNCNCVGWDDLNEGVFLYLEGEGYE